MPIAGGIPYGAPGDPLTQYLYLPGRTIGQTLGATAHANGTLYDLAIEGRLLLGTNIAGAAFTTGLMLQVSGVAGNNASIAVVSGTLAGGLSGTASGTINLLSTNILGSPGYSGGSYTLRGLNFLASGITNPAGVTVGIEVGRFQFAFSTNSGTISSARGNSIVVSLSSTVGQPTCPIFYGLDIQLGSSRTPITALKGIYLSLFGAINAAVTTVDAYEVNPNFYNNANVVDWNGLSIPNITLPTGNKWGLNLYGDVLKSRIGGPTAIGWVPATNAAVTSFLHLAAGAAGAGSSPLKIPPGTNLTNAESGAVENNGTDFFVTDGTGDRNRIAPRLLSRTLGIDATAVAATTIYTVPTGRKLVVVDVIIRTTAYNSGNFTCNVKGAAVGDIVASFTTTFTAIDQGIKPVIVTPFTIQAATQVIQLDITASTAAATTTVAVDLIGYLI